MPYFEVWLNDELLARAGTDDVCSLSAHVVAVPDGSASLGVHGMRTLRDGAYEHLDWVSRWLRRGDRVEIAYLLSAEASPPVRHPPLDSSHIEEGSKEIEAKLREKYPDGVPAPRRIGVPIVLRVTTTQTAPVAAAIGQEEQLQAVVNWSERGCVIEVDALTVLEGGRTKGRHWLKQGLSPGERIEITYAA